MAQLLQILQGLGATADVSRVVSKSFMVSSYRKKIRERGMRNNFWGDSAADASLDRHSLHEKLAEARQVCLKSIKAYPAAAAELNSILGDIDEQLARLS
ncbi:hypothetical protein [Lentzea sp. HUAS12]|uniref:hypothetical protein n=1 Tax=Lentzea sp. HUAS12 TaxID=2951806 RepID=UPI00209CEBB2|nr:hypothetical protein [Lentzea sp. HUAS12]USX49075.1 hypothetical protein ND450_26935 [Lentzea sp. HUAS12]